MAARRLLLCVLPLTLIVACASEPAPGLDGTTESSAPPAVIAEVDEMNTLGIGDEVPIEMVFAQFVEAVRTGDAGAVAAFVQFPLDAGVPVERDAFLSEFYPNYLGEHDASFARIVAEATPEELEPLDDGRFQYMALDSGWCEEEPECSGAAMIFYFAREGETWRINEIQFAG